MRPTSALVLSLTMTCAAFATSTANANTKATQGSPAFFKLLDTVRTSIQHVAQDLAQAEPTAARAEILNLCRLTDIVSESASQTCAEFTVQVAQQIASQLATSGWPELIADNVDGDYLASTQPSWLAPIALNYAAMRDQSPEHAFSVVVFGLGHKVTFGGDFMADEKVLDRFDQVVRMYAKAHGDLNAATYTPAQYWFRCEVSTSLSTQEIAFGAEATAARNGDDKLVHAEYDQLPGTDGLKLKLFAPVPADCSDPANAIESWASLLEPTFDGDFNALVTIGKPETFLCASVAIPRLSAKLANGERLEVACSYDGYHSY